MTGIDAGVQIAFSFFALAILCVFFCYVLAGFIGFMKRMLG